MITNLNSPKIAQTTLTSFSKCINKVLVLTGGNASVDVLPANPKRLYSALINSSENPITLILGERSEGAIDKGIPLNPGGSFEINLMNLYRGKIAALSEKNTKISFVECSED